LRAANRRHNRAIAPFGACAAFLQSATCFRTQAWTYARPYRAGAECACSRCRQLKHDPEKWKFSEKILLKQKSQSAMTML
jgi:hypothetical protein